MFIADAVPQPPLIVWLAFSACFKSIVVAEFAETATPDSKDMSLKSNVVPIDEAVVLVRIMFVTTVVVADGTVYKVVEDAVVRNVLDSGLMVFGI